MFALIKGTFRSSLAFVVVVQSNMIYPNACMIQYDSLSDGDTTEITEITTNIIIYGRIYILHMI